MPSSKPVIYGTYPQKAAALPRSRLFGLEPIGIGLPSCESLISYLVRLARAHCMSTRDLIRIEFMWRYAKQAGINSSGFFTGYSKTLNGVGDYASGFVRITEELNGRSDLRFLTMLPWRGVIPEVGTGLLAAEPKWCPRCARKQPFIPRLPMQDHCDYCGCWLGKHESFSDMKTPTEREIWLAKAISDMVSHGAYADEHATQQRLRSILSGFVADYADGEKRRLSRMLGLTEASMACWITKGKKPLLPQLLDICHQFGVLPTEMFKGVQPKKVPTSSNQPKLYDIQQRLDLDATERERVRIALAEIADDSADRRSLTEVSSALGARKNFLIYWFKDLCATVTAKHRKGMQRLGEVKWEIEAQRVRDEVARLCNAGIYPSKRKVEAAISPLSLHRRRLCSVYKEVTGGTNSD